MPKTRDMTEVRARLAQFAEWTNTTPPVRLLDGEGEDATFSDEFLAYCEETDLSLDWVWLGSAKSYALGAYNRTKQQDAASANASDENAAEDIMCAIEKSRSHFDGPGVHRCGGATRHRLRSGGLNRGRAPSLLCLLRSERYPAMSNPDAYRKALNIHGLLRTAILASDSTLEADACFGSNAGTGVPETLDVAELMMRDLIDEIDRLSRRATEAEKQAASGGDEAEKNPARRLAGG